ncbi:hypothetical protein CROQUDRAFT_91783 [Cronartium quercuum f. sp. fusiforme G11]|uniref:Uncharacterized protein n=1 Tax=Cronartium quercuum f. sp. fusiforme G11 TaxID=708437 RepID=A0A9P6TCA6_9BASI|nr:hypothetical protein CROQUDRAFT_91783 [Cronartium quercuum f. sp. fusiforme G11]
MDVDIQGLDIKEDMEGELQSMAGELQDDGNDDGAVLIPSGKFKPSDQNQSPFTIKTLAGLDVEYLFLSFSLSLDILDGYGPGRTLNLSMQDWRNGLLDFCSLNTGYSMQPSCQVNAILTFHPGISSSSFQLSQVGCRDRDLGSSSSNMGTSIPEPNLFSTGSITLNQKLIDSLHGLLGSLGP